MNFIKKYTSPLKNFLVLWFGQSVSMLGSSMTGFAITIWVYQKTGSALALSVSGLLYMVPKMVTGVLAGPLVDRLNKKAIMICTDIGAGVCTLILFLLLKFGMLEIWHIYCLNIISSILGAFQSPASDIAVTAIVPKEHYVRASGLQSFSGGTVQVLAPVFAAAMLGIAGMEGIIIIDFITMIFACLSVAFLVKIPNIKNETNSKFNLKSYFHEMRCGFDIIKSSKILRRLMSFMVFINFVAGMTYFNLLSPMILARTENNSHALAFVNGAIGLGSIIGALLIFAIPTKKSKVKTMFLCTALSFFFGDILLSVGGSVALWVTAGFMSSIFLPAFNANESYFWRTVIPIELQGRAFSLKYALQSGIIPIGLLAGGLLADYIFEPLMSSPSFLPAFIFGSGKGSGMAAMFFITGIAGTILSILGFLSKSLQKAEDEIK